MVTELAAVTGNRSDHLRGQSALGVTYNYSRRRNIKDEQFVFFGFNRFDLDSIDDFIQINYPSLQWGGEGGGLSYWAFKIRVQLILFSFYQ